MAVSQAQKLAKAKYQQEKRSLIAAEVSKAKGEEYRAKAAELGISLSALIQRGIEEYICNRIGGEFTTTRPDSLSASEKELIEVFNRLPDDAQKSLIKTCKAINQLIEDVLDERQRYCDYWITASNAKQQLEEEVEKLKKIQPQNQAP